MNKLSNMFKKSRAVVNYIDLDNNNAKIDTSGELTGKSGSQIEYDPADKIQSLVSEGYILVNDEFSTHPIFSNDEEEFQITFKHGHQVVDAGHLAFGLNKSQLQKVITQTVHYTGAAMRTLKDNVTEVVFNRILEFDKVTGGQIGDKGWKPKSQRFMMIGTPTLPGFIPDKAVVGGEQVTPNSEDKTYTVNFSVNRELANDNQKAIIKYVDISAGNSEITSDELEGKPNLPIDYSPEKRIKELTNEGYILVNNGFNPNNEVEFFSNSDSYTPTFIITLKHTSVAVDTAHPNAKVDPSEYQRTVKFVVNFTGAGEQTPESVTQTINWSRTVTAIGSSGKVIPNGEYTTEWKADQDSYRTVEVPSINGYYANVKEVVPNKPALDDKTQTVTYQENGKMVPFDENGNVISGADQIPFETDPNDPTRILADQIVPDIKGYTHQKMTINPADPGRDVKVTYQSKDDNDVMVVHVGDKNHQEPTQESSSATQNVQGQPTAQENTSQQNVVPQPTQPTYQPSTQRQTANVPAFMSQPNDQVAIVNFIDVDHNGMQLTSSGPLTGKPGESINDLYSTEIPLKAIRNAGYEVVFNSFDQDGFIQRFDNNDLMIQVFTIGVRKRRDK